jgi:hypothetical protein
MGCFAFSPVSLHIPLFHESKKVMGCQEWLLAFFQAVQPVGTILRAWHGPSTRAKGLVKRREVYHRVKTERKR